MCLMNWVIWIERAVSLRIMGWWERIVYFSSEALALMAVWYWFLLELLLKVTRQKVEAILNRLMWHDSRDGASAISHSCLDIFLSLQT